MSEKKVGDLVAQASRELAVHFYPSIPFSFFRQKTAVSVIRDLRGVNYGNILPKGRSVIKELNKNQGYLCSQSTLCFDLYIPAHEKDYAEKEMKREVLSN